MSNYYIKLGIQPDASQAEIQIAFDRQRNRYDPELVANIDSEIRQVAEQRTAELEHIYQVLVDPQRRQQYDVSIGLAPVEPSASRSQPRRTLSARERWYALTGALVAVLLIGAIWVLTGRDSLPQIATVGEVDRPAPDIALPALGGGEIRLADYQGKVVLVNFWGTWCEPCREEMPALQAAYDQLQDQGFVIIGVNLTDGEQTRGLTESDVRDFLDVYGVTYPIALDMEGSVASDYRVSPIPISFFIDLQGSIRYVRVGELTFDDVKARFGQLKQEATALHK
ncbi:MAG: redoxin domain-containing protein [Chloroflexales bacterium]|nr:redoxin domain-containing protein [Chloroflexales bacterium]